MAKREDEDDFDELWQERDEAMQERVEGAVKGDCLVAFSAFEEDSDGLPVDNLDKVAVRGRCRFVRETDKFFGEGKNYESAEVSDPTWLQVAVLANDMIGVTGDEHHYFLEGVTELREEGGVKIVKLEMGS